MNLKELIEKQQTIVDKAKAEGRAMTDEEKREFEEFQTEIDRIKNKGADNEATKRAAEAERKRILSITSMCRDFGLDAEDFIKDAEMTEEKCRAEILEKLKKNKGPASVRVTKDEGDKFREAATDALQLRCGQKIEKPVEGATELRNMSLKDLAIESMTKEGKSESELRRMSGDELYTELSRQYFNSTSAFPAILDSTIRKNIVSIYNAVPTTFQNWCSKGSVSDFKVTPDHNYIIGGGAFEKVGENGELKSSKPETSLLPQRKIDTYGTQFSMSRQAFINDDIGFLSNVPGVYAAAAKRKINQQVYELLFNNNATIYDGKVLFNADHGNLESTGSKPTLETINKLMLKMQTQKDPFGEAINLIPRMLILPVGYGLNVDTILHSTSIKTSENDFTGYNPLANKGLTYVEDATLNNLADTNACPWFLVADPISAKSVQIDYLNGNETPTLRRMETPGMLGFVWDIYMDWGITVIDWRGIARNNGVAITI